MGVYTFVCKSGGEGWTAKQHGGDLESAATSSYDLQRKLVQAALATESSGGSVQTSFSYVTPSSAVFQVIIGGGAMVVGGAATGAQTGDTSAVEAPPVAEEKKEEKEESDEEDWGGINLFD